MSNRRRVRPTAPPSPSSTIQQATEFRDRYPDVAALITWHDEAIAALTKGMTSLAEEVDKLASRLSEPPVVKEDDPAARVEALNTQIVAFLNQHRGLVFNGTAIAENIGLDRGPVYDRLRTLAAQGRIQSHVSDGRRALYSSIHPKGDPARD